MSSSIKQIKEKVKQSSGGEFLAKTYWNFRKVPAVQNQIISHGRKRKDKMLFDILPKLYDEEKKKPVDEDKVIFVEARIDKLGNSFTYLYDMLKTQYRFKIHVHYLRETFVSNSEYEQNCKKLIKDAATAKYIFLSEASNVISCIDKRPETVVVQLWHACGAFKRFGMSTADYRFGLNAEQQRRHPFYRNFSYVTVSSPEIVWAYEEAMDLKENPGDTKVVPTGTSRTDVFFDDDYINRAYEHLYEKFPAARGKKVILFAPTFRGRIVTAATAERFDPMEFYETLRDEYVVVMKHHPLARRRPVPDVETGDDFVYDATATMSIEDLLCVSDICISDYSSLIFEYSLFEKPMLFYAYDLDEYFDWRGFYYNYDELTPGPVCKSHYEMIDYIRNIDTRFDREEVHAFRERFMSSCDGHATERILKLAIGEEKLEKMRRRG